MRIAIVNDTLMAVEALRRVVSQNHEHTITWVARDGEEAIKACANDTPDLILMDIIMPVMDGVEATRKIMQNSPCAILLVTSSVSGNAPKVFEAMGAGALDAINTPILEQSDSAEMGEGLLRKINIIGQLISYGEKKQKQIDVKVETTTQKNKTSLIAIGSSTGGPAALVSVLKNLPEDFSAAIAVVQHVDKQFIAGFITWLDEQITLPVRMAHNGDKLVPGTILVADSEQHLILLKDQTLSYTKEPEAYPYKPSVNVFFESIAHYWNGNATGILLTGMGRDGALGLFEMHEKGFTTMAQEKSTCAVYGMPKAAVELNAVDFILSPVEINAQIVQSLADTDNSPKINKNMEI